MDLAVYAHTEDTTGVMRTDMRKSESRTGLLGTNCNGSDVSKLEITCDSVRELMQLNA